MRKGIIITTPQFWKDSGLRKIIAKEFYIERLEFMQFENCFWILIEDDRLDKIKEGELIPRYEVSFRNTNNEILFDKIERIK